MSEETDISDASKSAKRSCRQNISEGCRMVGTSSMPSGATVPLRIGQVRGLEDTARLSWSFMARRHIPEWTCVARSSRSGPRPQAGAELLYPQPLPAHHRFGVVDRLFRRIGQ